MIFKPLTKKPIILSKRIGLSLLEFIMGIKKYIALFLLVPVFGTFAQMPEVDDFCSWARQIPISKSDKNLSYTSFDNYDVTFYHLNLLAESTSNYLEGEVKVVGRAINTNMDTLVLELTNQLKVEKVYLGEASLDFEHKQDILKIFFQEDIEINELFDVSIKYKGQAASENGRGYNSANTNQGTRVSWTLSEPFYSKDWWPCKQDLNDKADSVWVFVTTSKENKVGSNGLLSRTVELENDKLRYEWKSNYPIAYYLISIAVANYMEYSFEIPSENGSPVFVQNYLYPDSAMFKNQKALIDCTYLQMNLLQEKYGTYPFIKEKYGHCIAPIGGGMEHQTMTTQSSFSFHLTIHEMGHSWFGNQVTCAKWNDIWINEGFATYTQYLGLQYLVNEAAADGFMAGMQSVVKREPGGSVYVPDEFTEDRSRIFSGRLSYYKGACIIHMIRYLINHDDLFFEILRTFQSRFKDKTATGEDFKMVLEELSGKDFDVFFSLWYYGEGYPIYSFQWTQYVNGNLEILSSQTSSTEKTPFFDMQFDLLIFFEDGTQELVSLEQNLPEKVFNFSFNKSVKNIMPNPRSQNLMDVYSIKESNVFPGEIRIEPNPVYHKTLIRFSSANPDRIIKVYDSKLSLVEQIAAPYNSQVIDLSNWYSGIYFLLIEESEKSTLKKLVKY
jgi:aminopeptidase N